ncbi:MAG: acetyl-CoA carboxylase biotin carboxyl carrier protein subunit [Bacteroidia bacterium]|nr:acetyl-CoA carboxylase biotin carboxyl carrier protein subunit [Bacteroidia bacterium]
MKEFSFNINGNAYKVNILNVEDDQAEVEVNGTTYQVALEKKPKVTKTPKLVRGKTPAHTGVHRPMTSAGLANVLAPLPGTITELKVKIGDQVLPEQVLLMMEAMKMENRVLAEKAGTVKAIKVTVGESVLQGQVVIEME